MEKLCDGYSIMAAIRKEQNQRIVGLTPWLFVMRHDDVLAADPAPKSRPSGEGNCLRCGQTDDSNYRRSPCTTTSSASAAPAAARQREQVARRTCASNERADVDDGLRRYRHIDGRTAFDNIA